MFSCPTIPQSASLFLALYSKIRTIMAEQLSDTDMSASFDSVQENYLCYRLSSDLKLTTFRLFKAIFLSFLAWFQCFCMTLHYKDCIIKHLSMNLLDTHLWQLPGKNMNILYTVERQNPQACRRVWLFVQQLYTLYYRLALSWIKMAFYSYWQLPESGNLETMAYCSFGVGVHGPSSWI